MFQSTLPRLLTTGLRRWYALLAIGILMLVANVLASTLESTDILTAGQDRRLTFQTVGEIGRLLPLAGVQGDFEGVREILGNLPINRTDVLSVLYIGNSQTMAIMDARPRDRIVAAWLSALLSRDGQEAFAVRLGSEANMTMSELLVKTVAAAEDNTHRADVEIVGIVLDGLRWVEPRGDLIKQVNIPFLLDQVRQVQEDGPYLSAAARVLDAILHPSEQRVDAIGLSRAGEDDGRIVTWLERQLNIQAERALPIFRARRELRGRINLQYTSIRNWAFGLTTSMRRPIAPAMYTVNLEFIELTLRILRRQGIKGIFYLAPIRPLEPNPYDPRDVERFRRDLANLCQQYGAIYLDYSRLIPETLWTVYPDTDKSGVGGQPDFAHFTGNAHQLLAERLVDDIGPMLRNWLTQKR